MELKEQEQVAFRNFILYVFSFIYSLAKFYKLCVKLLINYSMSLHRVPYPVQLLRCRTFRKQKPNFQMWRIGSLAPAIV